MSVYVVTGRLGSGKTLIAVSRIRDALRDGRRVATNLDLKVEKMLGPMNDTARVTRVPDKPTCQELEDLGLGADVLDESRYGLLVLDELAAWLNARQWGDKQRQELIDWLIHSRKRRWDIIFIVQHLNMIDKQIRDALAEYIVHCKRLDKVKVPFFGALGKLVTLGMWDGRVGKVHLGVVVYAAGSTPQSPLVTDRWIYRGHDLYEAYNTEQIFTSSEAAPYSYLTPWHTVGRYLAKPRTLLERLFPWWFAPTRERVIAPVPDRLHPLLKLQPDVRWQAARALTMRGVL